MKTRLLYIALSIYVTGSHVFRSRFIIMCGGMEVLCQQ